MDPINALRLEAYKQCNEYVRSADVRKDTLLILYGTLTLSTVILSAVKYASEEDVLRRLLIVGPLSLVILGIIFLVLFTLFRGYHTAYLIQAVIIEADIAGRQRPEAQNLPSFLKWGVEQGTFGILNLFVAGNLFLALWAGIKFDLGFALLASILLFVVAMLFYREYLSSLDLKKPDRLPERYMWILRSLS